MIPSNALGVIALQNDAPDVYKDTDRQDWLFDIVEKTSTTMTLRQKVDAGHEVVTYLGAIVSADRQTTYWVNNTKPLP